MRRSIHRLFALAVLTAGASAPLLAEGAGAPLLITVDDLPLTGGTLHAAAADRELATRGMLAALARHGIRAVGLVTWSNVHGPEDVALLDLWLAGGHELGNHSYRHLDYHRTDTKEWLADIEKSRAEIGGFLASRGKPAPRYFRFPFLREGDSEEKLAAVRDYLLQSGQRNLPVTIDDQDWSFERPFVEAIRAGRTVDAGRVAHAYHESLHLSVRHHRETSRELFEREVPQILLLHGTAIGAAEWDELFSWLEAEGFRFATVDEVLTDPVFERAPHFLGPRGPGLWDRFLDERWRADADSAVRALFAEQVAGWNRGDIEAFVSAYADDALFVSASRITRGRQEVVARYRQRYPDGNAMGRLTLEIEEIRLTAGGEVSMLGDAVPGRVHGARVLARWTLVREGEQISRSGPTLVNLERRAGRWWIVEDASMEEESHEPDAAGSGGAS